MKGTTGNAIRKAVKKAKADAATIPLRRELGGTVYAWQCAKCGAAWKVYQSQCHYPDCGAHLIDMRKLRKGRRVKHTNHGLGTVMSVRRERNPNGRQDGTISVLFDRDRETRTMWLRPTVVTPRTALGKIRRGAWWEEPAANLGHS